MFLQVYYLKVPDKINCISTQKPILPKTHLWLISFLMELNTAETFKNSLLFFFVLIFTNFEKVHLTKQRKRKFNIK